MPSLSQRFSYPGRNQRTPQERSKYTYKIKIRLCESTYNIFEFNEHINSKLQTTQDGLLDTSCALSIRGEDERGKKASISVGLICADEQICIGELVLVIELNIITQR